MTRLSPAVFKIPTDKIRSGYYTDRYFLRVREVLMAIPRSMKVGYQFFPRENGVICGLDEAIAILKTCAGIYHDPRKAERLYHELRTAQWKLQDASACQHQKEIIRWEWERSVIRKKLNDLWENKWSEIKVFALEDGERVKENEPVLAIVGNPRYFAHLETPLLGAIARPTSTATAVDKVVKAANGKKIFFFSARFDHYWVQTTDGYAALKAGAFGVSTDANADYWGIESVGTMPHFLIGCFGGDTAKACLAYDKVTNSHLNRIALVDWDNDCIGTTKNILIKLICEKLSMKDLTPELFAQYAKSVVGSGKGKLWGVRFDTSGTLRDRSIASKSKSSYGVCPELVRKGRREFDRWGCQNLKIIVSGGFDEKKIILFENHNVPVDIYGIGSSLFRHHVDMTADIIEYEGKACAKVGRQKSDWSRLRRVR